MTGPEFDGQFALVTGGAGDIGSAIVDALIARGARVASSDLVTGRSGPHDRLHETIVDSRDPYAVNDWVTESIGHWGTPSIAIISAGVVRPGRLVDIDAAGWSEVIDGSLTSAYFASIAAIRAMIAVGQAGRIVFLGSWAASSPHPHIGAYTAAKAGLRGLMRTLALDHASDGILINEVAPGVVDAGVSGPLLRAAGPLRERTLHSIPLGRLSTMEDVVRDVLHLVSPRNRSTTGSTLISDGGAGLASRMNTGGPE